MVQIKDSSDIQLENPAKLPRSECLERMHKHHNRSVGDMLIKSHHSHACTVETEKLQMITTIITL